MRIWVCVGLRGKFEEGIRFGGMFRGGVSGYVSGVCFASFLPLTKLDTRRKGMLASMRNDRIQLQNLRYKWSI